MQKTKLLRFVESFVLFPIITISGSIGGGMPQVGASIVSTSQFVFPQKLNIESSEVLALAKEQEDQAKILKLKADAIDKYFKDRAMPLLGTGEKMVLEAEKNGLDWRLVAAIAVRESTGGKYACKGATHNPFGWGSCKIGFTSNDHAIETVARNLGGNNPKTAMHYANKNTIQILRAYNPPSIVPKYAEQVIAIMDKMGAETIVLTEETPSESEVAVK